MKQKIVGTFHLGDECVQVVLREGVGGEFYYTPGDIPYCRMKIGADQLDWSDLVSTLMHEAGEAVAGRLMLRWSPQDDLSRDRIALLFVMTHPQFSEVCARVGAFLAECLPACSAAWKKWKGQAK